MKFKLLNETTNNYGDVIKVGDIVKYTTRTDNWLHESVRGTNCGEVVEIRKYDDGKVYIKVSHWKLNTISNQFPNQLEVKESRKEKEIVITKDKFQEFRKMILENLGIVLKIVFGNKCLTHRFDTKDYMDYEPKNVTKEEYAINMVERDIHEVYNIMTKGYVSVMTGNQLEKKDLTEKYNVSTLVSTGSNTEEKTHTEIKTKDGKKEMVNVRALEEKIEKGLLEKFALERAKQTLEKIENRTTGIDTWVLENNEGTYGTEIVITKEGHIDLYLCIMEKYSSRVSYIRVGNFQPEFELGDVHLPNGKVKEYKKLGTIINALNKEYEQYGFYFTADTKNNRRMLADARKSYDLNKKEEESSLGINENMSEDEVFAIKLENSKDIFETVMIFKEIFANDDVYVDAYDVLADRFNPYYNLGKIMHKKFKELLDATINGELGLGDMDILCTELFRTCGYEEFAKYDTEIKILDFKTRKKCPTYEWFMQENCWDGTRTIVNSEKIYAFENAGLKVELFEDVEEVLVWDVKEQLDGQISIDEITFDIDGEGSLYITEKKDVDYATAQKEYRLRLQSAPEETYNKTNFDLKINGECVYGFRVDLCKGHEHKFELADELLRNLKFQKRVWSGGEYSWMQGEYREKRIKEQFGTEEEMMKFFDKIEKILVGFDTSEPTKSEEVIEVVAVEKMEEKEMNTINKNALNNRMVKLGEFLKENRDKDAVENKVLELFPKAMEVEVFEGDNVVYFLVGQDYVGKAPTKKEMKEQDSLFKEVIKVYGLSVHMSVDEEKIKMDASVGVDYKDVYGHYHYTDYTVKEMEIETPVTIEEVKELTDELEKHIKDHINSVLDLMDNIEKEKFEYMYKKTVVVKRNDRYELTSSLEDVWTGLTVYVGDSSNMLMIPNSKKSFLTDIVEDFLCSNIDINETVIRVQEKIKKKFEYSYSKSVTVKEEEEVYVLKTPSDVELFWYYKDAYSRMVELVNEMSEKFSNNYEVTMDDYSAKMEMFSWKITTKKVK